MKINKFFKGMIFGGVVGGVLGQCGVTVQERPVALLVSCIVICVAREVLGYINEP